ncbi:tyrosine-type recombinase/integrase [Halorarum halophilum]|nr:site-specific integrase [Halobaculum halophilum]
MDGSETEPNRSIRIVPTPNEELLTEKEQLDYYEYRKSFLTWLLKFGKNPEMAKGYSPYTVYATGYRSAAFDRWVWDHNGGYKAPPTEEDATVFMDEVALSDDSDCMKGKKLEMLRRYSKWLSEQHGQDQWAFPWKFKSGGGNNQPRDFLSVDERRAIRQAALGLDGNPAYGVEDKDALAVTDGSWKFTSIVWTSLDAALRPVEVGRAKVGWVDPDNGVLRIPIEESSKNDGNWTVSVTDRTATALKRWLEERASHPRYEDTDALWLTRHGNRYGANELRRLLHGLCDRAGIDYEHRQMSWYTIRHSVGTYMTKERDLAATKAQLRHKCPKTTMKYDQVPVEDRRDALDRMG